MSACVRYFGSDGTLCATHHAPFGSPSETRCADAGRIVNIEVRDTPLSVVCFCGLRFYDIEPLQSHPCEAAAAPAPDRPSLREALKDAGAWIASLGTEESAIVAAQIAAALAAASPAPDLRDALTTSGFWYDHETNESIVRGDLDAVADRLRAALAQRDREENGS